MKDRKIYRTPKMFTVVAQQGKILPNSKTLVGSFLDWGSGFWLKSILAL